MKNFFLLFLLILLTSCPNEYNDGSKSLLIRNNSDEVISFWYSRTYSVHHYPDISMQITKPQLIPALIPNGGAGVGPDNPDWEFIFSQLPEGLFSIYFFETKPETQEDWDILRNNVENLYRKDITLGELIENNYTIEYP